MPRTPSVVLTLSLVALAACSAGHKEAENLGPVITSGEGATETPVRTDLERQRGADETAGKDAEKSAAATGSTATTTPQPRPREPMAELAEMEPEEDYDMAPGAGDDLMDLSVARESRGGERAQRPEGKKLKVADGSATGAPIGRAYRPTPTPRPMPPPSVTYDPPTPPLPPLAQNTESYTDYGVNGFEVASRDHLSTFSVDVDTASYTVTRRKLNEGYLPPAAAVRVEEFVNYFPYEYKQPDAGSPFAVDFEATPSPFAPGHDIVRIGVQGKTVRYDSRKPVHLTFLVDTSCSMQPKDKLGLVKDTLKMLTEELEDGDTVAIATYAGSSQVVLNPTPMSQKQDIIRSLDRLSAGGSTAMASGIDLAYQLADRTFKPGTVNRVIVASDGDANVGTVSHSDISKKIRGYANKGVTLTTLGFGNGNYKDSMMERLANDGDGNYFYIDSLRESRRLFVDQLSSTLEVIAKDVKIQVDWNPEAVEFYRLVGYENRDIADRDFRNDKVDAGEIGAGHQVTALYEVVRKSGSTADLATVRIRYKAPGADSPAVERAFPMAAETLGSSFASGSRQYRIAFAAASFADILRGAPQMEGVRLRDVEAIARAAARPEFEEDSELIKLIERAAQLRGEGTFSSTK